LDLSEHFVPVVVEQIAAAANYQLVLGLLAVLHPLRLEPWLIKLAFKVLMQLFQFV
jgi:hypothetical protein